MLSIDLGNVLGNAFSHAKQERHEFMTLEHLLCALLDNEAIVSLLKKAGGDIEELRFEVGVFIDAHYAPLGEDDHRETQPTDGFQRVLQRAVYKVQSAGEKEVQTVDVLLSMYSETDSHAVFIMESHGVSRDELIRILAEEDQDESNIFLGFSDVRDQVETKKSALDEFALNLNEKAKAGKIDALIGRTKEIERLIQVLCRRRKNNPLLVGEPGVGKTAIAEGLAKMIVDKKTPAVLQNCEVYAIEIGSLVAGTKYRGDFEKRLKLILKDLKSKPDAIVFIDEIHTMIGAGATSGGVMDASNLLKPALARGELKCIGATTYNEYRNVFEKDRALARRFQKIDVEEPTIEQSIEIIQGLIKNFEEHHNVKYQQSAIVAAVELSARYINDRFLPDKALDVIDEAGALKRIKNDKDRNITLQTIEHIVAKMARIPPKQISQDDKSVLERLEKNLKMVVFGQDEAIEDLATAIKLSRCGLGEQNKPIGSFLFTGPTGVGKTEVTKQLALALGIEFLRFDMSEYMERHSISRLIGAPPGYVGYDEGGLLTESISKHPHSVLLLDEIEKAHPDMFNILLQVMDHGTLTDNNGRKASFRNVILVMTSNVGAAEMSRSSMGFTAQDHSSDTHTAINKLFTPEFRNRLDKIVQFKALDKRSISYVVDKFIIQLEAQLQDNNVALTVSDAARNHIIENGYNPSMGARPMARYIQEHIKKPLADDLLFGKLKQGGSVSIGVRKNKLNIATKALRKKQELKPVK